METRKKYTREFKLEAIRLFEQPGKSAADVARDLGIRRNQLYKWRDELNSKGKESVFKGAGRNAAKDQSSELALMKRRIAKLEEENTILKKAAVYFAKELP